MNYKVINNHNLHLGEYIKTKVNKYTLLITGSYNSQMKIGSYKAALIYNSYARIYEQEVINPVSANHCMITGIEDTIKRINLGGRDIYIVVATALGFKSAIKGIGLYNKQIQKIINLAGSKDNQLNIVEVKAGGVNIRNTIKHIEQQVSHR